MKKRIIYAFSFAVLFAGATAMAQSADPPSIDPGETKCTVSSAASENTGSCMPSHIYNGDVCEATGFGPACDGTVLIIG